MCKSDEKPDKCNIIGNQKRMRRAVKSNLIWTSKKGVQVERDKEV